MRWPVIGTSWLKRVVIFMARFLHDWIKGTWQCVLWIYSQYVPAIFWVCWVLSWTTWLYWHSHVNCWSQTRLFIVGAVIKVIQIFTPNLLVGSISLILQYFGVKRKGKWTYRSADALRILMIFFDVTYHDYYKFFEICNSQLDGVQTLLLNEKLKKLLIDVESQEWFHLDEEKFEVLFLSREFIRIWCCCVP